MVDVVLLELEGVLFDTREARRFSLRDALVKHGFAATIDIDAIDGFPVTTSVRAALAKQHSSHDETLVDLVALSAERSFSSRIAAYGADLCDGAPELVRETAGVARLAIVTGARRADVETILRLASLTDFFTVVISADDVLDPKPSPEGYRMALDRLNRQRPIPPKQALAIESSVAGIRAARSAEIRCAAVGPLGAHIAMEADAYVPSLVGQTIRAIDLLTRAGEEHVQ